MTLPADVTEVETPTLEELIPAVARDVARDLLPRHEIATRHRITETAIARLESIPAFHRMVAAERAEWMAAENAKSRARLKAQHAVEESIVSIAGIVRDPKMPAAARVAAFTALKETGQFEKAPPEEARGGGPGGFSITINLGDRSDAVTINNQSSGSEDDVDG